MMKAFAISILIALLFTWIPAHAEPTVWYVHPDSVLNSIQAALDSCADNDIVLVGPGTYFENIVWPYKHGIHLVSELGPDTSIIDGGGAASVIVCTTGVDTTSIISGFTIQNGYSPIGGGLNIEWGASPSIANNKIYSNSADEGGGIGCMFNASPIIRQNVFIRNMADFGGAISCDQQSHPLIVDNQISDNSASYSGGGIAVSYYSAPRIIGNLINNNAAAGRGAGIYSCIASSPVIDSCTISNNCGDGFSVNWGSSGRINYTNIYGNSGFGVWKYEFDPDLVNAKYNWWGDTSGPYHPDLNPSGMGDSVSDYVDFTPWLDHLIGVEEEPITNSVEKQANLGATIFSGPLQLPEGKECRVYDITGRIVEPTTITRGIYFIEVEGKITQKVVKVR